MGRFQVIPGTVAVADERLVRIVRIDAKGQVVVCDLATNQDTVTSAAALCAPAADEAAISRKPTTVEEVTEEHWQIARQRERAIADIDPRQDVTDQVQRTATRLGISRRTVFRWLTAYRESPQTSTLLPKPVGPRVGSRRLGPELEKLIIQAINDVYLQKVRAKKEEVVRMVGLRSSALGLKPPSRKPILARLKALDLRMVARARLQPGEAASLYDFVPGSYQVSRALEVVQIDHTPMDVIVVDEARRLPIGRPWLTLAVDVATRVVVGFYVSMEAPSSTSVALCLTQATLPKELWLKQRNLTCNWPVWGLPQALHADNGADFTSAALRRGCDEHGIRLILRPVATPHYGGHIERLIGTLMGRVHLLPGTTGSNPQDRGEYQSEAEARLTMAELERWLTLEICDQYHHRTHKGIGRSPLAAWEEAMNGTPQVPAVARSLPDQPDQFTVSFLPFFQRKLQRNGLHLFSIRYWDNLLPSIMKLGELTMVRYDPRNLSKVYVMGPDRRYFPVPYADLSLPPISLWEQRAALASLQVQGERAPTQATIFKAVNDQRALVSDATAKTKAARRQVQRQKDSESATMDRTRMGGEALDYSKPVAPSDAELWDT